jgi:F0F1-type ATP synthase assembly protein I
VNSEEKYKARAFYLGRKMYWYGIRKGALAGVVAGIVIGYLLGQHFNAQ